MIRFMFTRHFSITDAITCVLVGEMIEDGIGYIVAGIVFVVGISVSMIGEAYFAQRPKVRKLPEGP